MTEAQVRALFDALDDVEVIVGSTDLGHPAAAVGDTFCSLAPGDGRPPETMPFATIVTKDVAGWDEASDLDRPGAFRVNLNVGRANLPTFDGDVDFSERDLVMPHPQYATQGWVGIVEPGPRTDDDVVRLLGIAHQRAVARRRAQSGGTP